MNNMIDLIKVTKEDLEKICFDHNMWEFDNPVYGGPKVDESEIYCGIISPVTNMRSCLTLATGAYNAVFNCFMILNIVRLQECDPLVAVEKAISYIKHMNVKHIVSDWGSGYITNKLIEKELNQKVLSVMYVANLDNTRIEYDPVKGYYKASRTLTLSNTFTAIKEQKIRAFKWEQFKQFTPEILSTFPEFQEDDNGNQKLRFDHPEGEPTGVLHAINIMYNVFTRINGK